MARTYVGGLIAALVFSVAGFYAVRATASSLDRFTGGGAPAFNVRGGPRPFNFGRFGVTP